MNGSTITGEHVTLPMKIEKSAVSRLLHITRCAAVMIEAIPGTAIPCCTTTSNRTLGYGTFVERFGSIT